MWFGTKDGLNKYDGYKFTVYKHDPGNLNSLSNNIVTTIYQDRSGVLWIGTEGGGLNRFNREKEIFKSYTHNPANDLSISQNSITSIFEDSSGVLWIGTSTAGLNRFNKDKEIFKHYKNQPMNPESISDNWITSILEDRSGNMWIGTRGGLNKFDKQKETFKRYTHNPDNQKSINNDIVSSIYEDHTGNLWIGTWSGLNIFNKKEENFTRYVLNKYGHKNLVMGILEDKKNTLWIATSGAGLYRYNPVTKVTQNFRNDITDPDIIDPNSLSSNLITTLYQDRSGLMWFGTKSKGIIKHDPRTEVFRHYRHQPENSNSLSQNYVRTFFESENGDIWIGTGTGGLNKYVPHKGKFYHYRHDAGRQNTLSNDDVINVKEDRDGRVWIGTGGGGLNKFDKEKQIFKRHFPNNSKNVNDNVIYSLCFDASGLLWIGTWGGLNKFDPIKETYRHYRYQADDNKSLSNDFVRTVYQDRNGDIWIGTNLGGLNKYDPNNDNFIRYMHQPENPNSISHNTIESIYEDSGGKLWIGTFGGGLNLFNRETEIFEHYSEKDGLPNDVIHGILEDDFNNLWLSTNKGLSKFNPSAKTFKNYDAKDGLQSDEFNTNAYLKTRHGEMFFGGINGFNVFHPDSIKSNPFPPPVVITDFQIFNKPVFVDKPAVKGKVILNKHISETDEIKLSYRDYVFSFEFAALDFTSPEKNHYQYFMEGFDVNWIDSGKRRFVTYTNLDPGEYIFRVKGTNNDGIWNQEGASVKIIITPPFWQTWWFRTLAILSVLLAAYTWYKRRINKLETKKKELEERVEERTRAANTLQNALDQVEHLKNQLRNVEQVASTDATVLILGESGTGKELVARAVHSISNRANRPLVKVNCSALPKYLIESELFGHEKGAFTGAISPKTGRFELADGGTIFLDEIGDLPFELQAKLLRVLQEGEFERLGNPGTVKVDVRVIAATNRDLEEAIKNGKFREDLYYRLNVFPVVIPPLRERKEDIPLLVKHFVEKFSAKAGKQVEMVSQNLIDKLQDYHWPGNVRELENIIERSVIITPGKKLMLGDWLPTTGPRSKESDIPTLEELEKKHILEVLELTDWRIRGEKGAANILNLKPTTLASRMAKLGIKRNN
jgi:DNA-binding NtrC family response regulator/ligand-binding sensor domain-containing protein